MLSPLRVQIFATMTSDQFECIAATASSGFDEPGRFEETIEGIENLIEADLAGVNFSSNQYVLAAARLVASNGGNPYVGVMADYAASVARELDETNRSQSNLVDVHRFLRSENALNELKYDLGLLTECVQRDEIDKVRTWLIDIACRLVGFSMS